MEDARALLNSIMGAGRNAKLSERKARKFSDSDICKKFLLGLCPHELFTNTKMDLGPCKLFHNHLLKEEFENDSNSAFYRRKWRGVLRSQLKTLLEDVDRRMEVNQTKIGDGHSKQLDALKNELSKGLKKAERAADEGNFEESRQIFKDTEEIKQKIEDLEANRFDETVTKESICAMCGLRVSAEEGADIKKYGRGWHTDGKQHLGFITIRAKMKELEREHAEDRKKGLRTPSPSPVKVEKKPVERKKRSRSPAVRQEREDDRRRKASRSRSPRRAKRTDDRRRFSSSRSRRRKGSPPRSPMNGRKKKERSRSRSAADRTKGAKRSTSRRRSRSPQKASKAAKHSSPKRKSSPSPGSPAPPPPGSPPGSPARRSSSPKREKREKQRKEGRKEGKERTHEEPEAETADKEPEQPEAEPAQEEEQPEPEPPKPPEPVRFVLGLGKLNFSMLGKRSL